ncbi:E6 protein [Bos taurus papillomavirus 21]|uniref:Protein E6 n=1 Tax=Bos taurus papillomavirus 21 TaxID=1887219 RepID=A0A1B2K238_9PAPI|nr:E6 protein [Bos taurus papillomavirus 21]ANZ90264.1 E6 protein [Bos taurus papillomavirus 21]
MAGFKTLTELLRNTPYTRDTLRLPCIFCQTILEKKDLTSFSYKRLRLINLDDRYYAACISCTLRAAELDRIEHTQCTIEGDGVILFTNKRLEDICMRCYMCAKLLRETEKLECMWLKKPFKLISDTWRGLCRHCLIDDDRGDSHYSRY